MSGSIFSERALREVIKPYPQLRLALAINDCILYVFRSLISGFVYVIKLFSSQLKGLTQWLCSRLNSIYVCTEPSKSKYHKLGSKKPHIEPIPYRDQFLKRSITYHGGIILGIILYIFVYYVLIKHHTSTTISVSLLILLVYLVILENSHNIRSILMLCLPLIFTNRGRALVFCCMLTMMISGPVKNSQFNLSELQLSLNCCKQYLIIRTDKVIEKDVIENLISLEKMVNRLVDNIKRFAEELKQEFQALIDMAMKIGRFTIVAIEKLKQIVNVCNSHTNEVFNNCIKTFKSSYDDCNEKLGSKVNFLCDIVSPLEQLCKIVRLPDVLCKIPRALIDIIDKTIGMRLRHYLKVIENELYVDIDVNDDLKFNGTKSKAYKDVMKEIKSDVDRKFWYIHLITRVFNLISLVLVIWITITATLYQMHYITEIEYDNMYIDGYIRDIDKMKMDKNDEEMSRKPTIVNASDDADTSLSKDQIRLLDDPLDVDFERDYLDTSKNQDRMSIFPLSKEHRRLYLGPFDLVMNEVEQQKVRISGLIWLAIMGYIFFFVLADFALYSLMELIVPVLKQVLFDADLPLVDITSKNELGQEIKYNRTYLKYLRNRTKNNLTQPMPLDYTNKTRIGAMYRRFMDSLEESVPNDVDILDTLEKCLPDPKTPDYGLYQHLGYLALFTFGAVILEAYALRTRHCIANLYYPKRAKKRAVWLYRKIMFEKPKYPLDQIVDRERQKGYLDSVIEYVASIVRLK